MVVGSRRTGSGSLVFALFCVVSFFSSFSSSSRSRWCFGILSFEFSLFFVSSAINVTFDVGDVGTVPMATPTMTTRVPIFSTDSSSISLAVRVHSSIGGGRWIGQ